jgi:hypothetical protein
MIGGHGLTRPLTATTKTPRRANKQPLRTCLKGFWMRFHSDKGISGLRLVEAVRVTQSMRSQISSPDGLRWSSAGSIPE